METDSIQLSSSNSNLDSFVFQSESDLASFSIIILLLLLLITFFRSAAKAYIIESESINQNGKNKDGIGERVSKNLQNSERILTAITAFNFILNTVLILLLSAYIHQIFFELLSFTLEIILLIGLLFILFFVIGELIPEYLATSSPSLITRITAYPVFWVDWIFRPFSSLYIRFTSFLKEKNPDNRKPISIDEITQVLHMNSDTESADEKEILEEIVKFGNKNVSDIMKPRTEVVSLDIKTSFPEVLGLFIESGFSRIPVYSGSLDNIRGILYVKDILPHSKKEDSFSWQSVIRPPFFVPETKKINALLQEFQKNKVHLAMVIDEYGGTAGIVTLEDIIEEIVGEIVDEFDEEDNFVSKIDENTFLFDGKTLIGDFLKIVKCDEAVFDEVGGEFETLAGLILELKGDIPQLQDKIKYAQFTFTIEAADKKRILKVKTEIETD